MSAERGCVKCQRYIGNMSDRQPVFWRITMEAQFYENDKLARLFHGNNAVADIYAPNIGDVEVSLNLLGWMRRGKWQKTDWGYITKLRRDYKH